MGKNSRHDRGAYAPGRLPRLLVVPADAQAYLPVGLEAPVGGHEAEAGRAEGVRRGEDDAPVVEALGVGAVGRAAQGEVPFEEVGL